MDDFNPTSTNITELLVVALIVVSVILLLRKRYDSNLPLLSYVAIIGFTNIVDRTLNPFLLYGGLGLALILRFEFMGTGFAKVVAYLATGSLCVITWVMLSHVLSS
jgi:hypothetical protein